MSDGQAIGTNRSSGTGGTQVRAAIAQAAKVTGVDFQYLMAQAKIESSLNPDARAPTSSAAGLYQFTNGTWLSTLGRHASEHGLGWVSDAIQNGGMSDPTTREQVMGLRYDPSVSSLMAAELAGDNRDVLSAQLGREPDSAELYLAHFLGSAGASQFLSALDADPSQSAASILPKAAAANRGIFYQDGAPRSLGGVMEVIRGKVSAAMNGSSFDYGDTQLAYEPAAQQQSSVPMGPIAREFHANQAEGGAAAPSRSMAETLASAFGTTGSSAPAHVRDAYAKLARFGL